MASCRLVLCLAWCASIAFASKTQTMQPFAVVGYVPEWRFHGIPFELIVPHLTHLLLFSIETDSKANLVELSRLPSKSKMKQIKQLCTESDTKLLISFGGYGRSNGFPQVSISEKLRKRFVDNTLKLMNEYELDGIDLNWEYPSNQQEWMGLFQIIKLFKTKSPEMVLTMAFYPGQENILGSTFAENYGVQSNIDLFLIMSYDNMRGGTSKHSTFEFAVKTVDNAIKGGLNMDKIALGLPFYARHMQSGDWKTYEEIVKDLRVNKGMKDDEIKKLDIWKGHYYNGYDMIVRKMEYAVDKGIGGVMIWENGQDVHDDSLSLLGAISSVISDKRQGVDEDKKEL